LAVDGLKRVDKEIHGSKIAILGWAFIANSDDDRNTASGKYRDLIVQSGGEVVIHDPYVASHYNATIERDINRALKNIDAVAIMTGHNMYKNLTPENIPGNKVVIVDGRNVIDPDTFINKGFIYKGVGRGDKNDHPIKEF